MEGTGAAMSGEFSAKLGAVRVAAGTCSSAVEGLVLRRGRPRGRGMVGAPGGLAALIAADTRTGELVEAASGEAVITAGTAEENGFVDR